MTKKAKTPGPEADRLKLKGDWKANVKKALGKDRPEEGWPDQADSEQKPKAKKPRTK